MTIKRVVNDVEMEFELTHDELFNAYCEQEHIWDTQACKDHLNYYYSGDEKFMNMSENVMRRKVDDMAFQLRRNLDKYGMDYSEAISKAFSEVISECIREA